MLDDVGEKRFVQLPLDFSVAIAGRSSHKLHVDGTRSAVGSKRDCSERFTDKPAPIDTHVLEESTIFQRKNESLEIAQTFRIFCHVWFYDTMY